MGGDSRLDRLEDELSAVKSKVQQLADEFAEAKRERLTMQMQVSSMDEKLDKVLAWVDGTTKVFGFARKHWRTIAQFGAGVVTAWGFTNPRVQNVFDFVTKFMGL